MEKIPTKIQNLYVDSLKKNKHPKSISLFYKLVETHKNKDSQSTPLNESASKPVVENSGKKIVASNNQSWQKEFQILKDEILLRQYSPLTLKTYTHWVRKFQLYRNYWGTVMSELQ